MKKLSFLLLLFISCNQKITPSDLVKINGYWEIVKAYDADDKVIEYKINETIDYFEIKDNQGFRKKVAPQFNGKYLVNEQSEKIKIVEIEGKTFIEYSTPYSKWKEQIVEILDNKLILKNDQGFEYYYKESIPYSLK
jgi:hypothetical protein